MAIWDLMIASLTVPPRTGDAWLIIFAHADQHDWQQIRKDQK